MHNAEANVSHKYEQKASQVNLNLMHIALPPPPASTTFSISLSPSLSLSLSPHPEVGGALKSKNYPPPPFSISLHPPPYLSIPPSLPLHNIAKISLRTQPPVQGIISRFTCSGSNGQQEATPNFPDAYSMAYNYFFHPHPCGTISRFTCTGLNSQQEATPTLPEAHNMAYISLTPIPVALYQGSPAPAVSRKPHPLCLMHITWRAFLSPRSQWHYIKVDLHQVMHIT